MMMRQPYQTYKEQSVMTMTSVEMLSMLYDRILRELYTVNNAFEKQDYSEINRGLQKVQQILNHLKSTLDLKYDIARNLMSLYDYFSWLTLRANVKKDPAGLDEMTRMIGELKDSYVRADKQARMHA
ncbi:MAG: flagellar export chaperone FliS [Peptococcaceae bacterium]|jgi:flagellar protein FliS|nr:flagellar export chaperone FliS [Peptococcaceae bacterium]